MKLFFMLLVRGCGRQRPLSEDSSMRFGANGTKNCPLVAHMAIPVNKILSPNLISIIRSGRSIILSFFLEHQEAATSQPGHRIGRYSRSVTQASICPRFYKQFVINHAILASTTGTLYLPKPDKNVRFY